MIKEIEDLRNRRDTVYHKAHQQREVLNSFKTTFPLQYEKLEYSEFFIDIKNEILLLEEEYKDLSEQLQKACKECDHDYVYTGYDSHYDYYQCKNCGNSYRI